MPVSWLFRLFLIEYSGEPFRYSTPAHHLQTLNWIPRINGSGSITRIPFPVSANFTKFQPRSPPLFCSKSRRFHTRQSTGHAPGVRLSHRPANPRSAPTSSKLVRADVVIPPSFPTRPFNATVPPFSRTRSPPQSISFAIATTFRHHHSFPPSLDREILALPIEILI